MLLLLLACSSAPTMEDALVWYGQQPTYLRPNSFSQIPKGLVGIQAEDCGVCHQEIYAEWKVSTHQKSWTDAQFQAELHKETSGDVQWMCVNCHTPTIQQISSLVTGLEGSLDQPIMIANPSFDSSFQAEGVSCAGCHVRDGTVYGPFGDTVAPHPVKKGEYLLSSSVCIDCHQAEVTFAEVQMACAFGTGREHAQGPYQEQTCQSCHMPKVQRPIVAGGKKRAARKHYFGGSLIPKRFGLEEEMAEMEAFFPQGLKVQPMVIQARNNDVSVTVPHQNTHAGHHLPSGDPERFIRFELHLIDQKGVIFHEEIHRIGAEYEWWPQVKKISDNRMKAQEAREWNVVWTDVPIGEYTVRLEVSKWRMSEENLEHHNLEKIVPSHVVIVEDSVQVNVMSNN